MIFANFQFRLFKLESSNKKTTDPSGRLWAVTGVPERSSHILFYSFWENKFTDISRLKSIYFAQRRVTRKRIKSSP